MNKQILIGLVVVAAVAGGGWYLNANRATDATMMTATKPQGAMTTIKELMTRGSAQCTVTNKTDNSESTGVVYIGSDRMRGDFKTVTGNPATTIESHMIADSEYIYTWSDAMPRGVKISVAASEGASSQTDDTQNLYSAQVEYDCDSWRVDEMKFAVPKDVQFMDISTMAPGTDAAAAPSQGANNPPSKSQQCGMCDQAPEPQRSQCRAALQCR